MSYGKQVLSTAFRQLFLMPNQPPESGTQNLFFLKAIAKKRIRAYDGGELHFTNYKQRLSFFNTMFKGTKDPNSGCGHFHRNLKFFAAARRLTLARRFNAGKRLPNHLVA